jgi:membrane-associated phospholipid phosphatase
VRRRAVLAACATTLVAGTAHAERAYELRHDTPVDIGVTLGGFGFVALTEASKPTLAPTACRWCDRDADGNDTLNGLDRAGRGLAWANAKLAAATSDTTAFLGTPSIAVGGLGLAAGADREAQHFARDALLVAEAAAVSGVVTQLVKYSVGRARPSTHDRAGVVFQSPDANLSFPSGHTSLAFSAATAAGTVASLRGYSSAPVVWVASLSLAALTGYLRVAARKHYVTDVLAGMVVGAAAGALVPLLFHGREAQPAGAPAAAAGAASGQAVAPTLLTFAW